MKRQQTQSKSNQTKKKTSKPILGKISKKKSRHITKATARKVVSLNNARATQMNLLDFPDEILLKFQSFLNYGSMCQCVETCTKLHQVYGDPSLWADMPVKGLKIANDGMEELKKISRFAKIKHINLDMDAIFTGITSITAARLTEVIQYVCWRNGKRTNLESLNLKGKFGQKEANCSTKHLRTLFVSIRFENLMKRLDLSENNLKDISPKLLKEAICCVEDVKLSNTGLTTTQLTALFSFITTKTLLKKLDLDGNYLQEVPPELLKEAIGCLEDVILSRTNLTTTQLTALFTFLPTINTLKKIDLYGNDFEEVLPGLLKEAICSVEDVNVSGTELTTTQLKALFTFIPTKTILKKIDLSGNNLKKISPELLKMAICHIEDVILEATELTTKQLAALFSFIPTKTTLKKIYLYQNNLEHISPKVLKEAVCHIEDVNLFYTKLTTKQLEALFSFIPTKTTLKKIDLTYNNLKHISPELLKEAVCHIEDVNLENTELTTTQLKALVSFIPTQNTLKRLNLSRNNCNMKHVTAKVLASVALTL